MEKCSYRVATFIAQGIKQVMFTFFIREEGEREVYESLNLPVYNFNVINVTDAIIEHYYNKTQIDNIIRDYSLDPEDEDYLAEYNKLKELKNKAKKEAKFLVQYAKDNNIV